MGYLKVVVTGHSKSGGYIAFMRPNMTNGDLKREEKRIEDGDIIPLPTGAQTIRHDKVSISEVQEAKAKLQRERHHMLYDTVYSTDSYYKIADQVSSMSYPVETTFPDIKYNTLVTLRVTTDYNGRVIDPPKYTVSTLTNEEYEKIEKQSDERLKKISEAAQKLFKEREKTKKSKKKRAVIGNAIATSIFLIITIVTYFLAMHFNNFFLLASFVFAILSIVFIIKFFKALFTKYWYY